VDPHYAGRDGPFWRTMAARRVHFFLAAAGSWSAPSTNTFGISSSANTATVLGYVDGLAALCAADVVVQHAGGVTCLEAFAAQRPVVMFDPLPGHGKRNARRMQAAGIATTVKGAQTRFMRRCCIRV
jgi:hypothetical protein